MSDNVFDLPAPDGSARPVYSLDDAADGTVAGGWSPAPVGSRRWLRESAGTIAEATGQAGPARPASPHDVGGPSSGAPAWPVRHVNEALPASYAAPSFTAEPLSPMSYPAPAAFTGTAHPSSSFTITDLDALPAPSAVPPVAVTPLLDAPTAQLPFVPAPMHVAEPEDAPTAVLDISPAAQTIELSDHARTTADKGLIEALCQVVLQGGSDLHVTSDAAPTIRIDGHLQPVLEPEPWDRHRVRSALLSLLTPERAADFDRELELDFAYSLSPESRFRVNFYQQRGFLGAVFRLIPTEIKTLEQLGMDPILSKFAGLPRGLVLVTGPTGSGKSTTLAALIDLVNRTRADHIVTVEDPIEFMHQHKKAIVNQREVGSDTHSFANALKHVLRQDPDVILIGELRDLETISVALTAAETGHLVFATLHTQDAAQTIDRVIDVFPPHQQDQVRTQLASTLQGVVCQTLVPRATGRGRVVATEIMMMTPAVGNLIREGKTYQIASSMQAGRELGMHTMDQNLAELVNSGKVTLKAAMDKVHDEEGFHRLVTRVEEHDKGLADSGIDFGDAFSGSEH